MQKYNYKPYKEILWHEDIGNYVSYGIKGFVITNDVRDEIVFVSDITTSLSKAQFICSIFNIINLCPNKLLDAVISFLEIEETDFVKYLLGEH